MFASSEKQYSCLEKASSARAAVAGSISGSHRQVLSLNVAHYRIEAITAANGVHPLVVLSPERIVDIPNSNGVFEPIERLISLTGKGQAMRDFPGQQFAVPSCRAKFAGYRVASRFVFAADPAKNWVTGRTLVGNLT